MPGRLGVVPSARRDHGGAFQYGQAILAALARTPTPDELPPITILGDGGVAGSRSQDLPPGWRWAPLLPPTRLRRVAATVRAILGADASDQLHRWRRRWRSAAGAGADIGRWYRRHDVKLIFWTAPDERALDSGLPFVMPVHDLQHRLQPWFPEVGGRAEREVREHLYASAARRAVALLADSETGREDILQAYGRWIDGDRVKILPFVPPPYLTSVDREVQVRRARAALPLPPRYFFYPAQFWPHKNHTLIVEALRLLSQSGLADVHVVCCGSGAGRLRRDTRRGVLRRATSFGLARRLTLLDYVPDALMGGLYLGAAGLVMPTRFGPTNIPLVEAWTTDCPVITSDLRGPREQAGDAALLVDPSSPEALADAMRALWLDAGVRRRLVAAGRRRAAAWTDADFARRLHAILGEAWRRVANGAPVRLDA